MWSEGQGSDLIEPLIKESWEEVEAVRYVHIGLLCTQEDPDHRPTTGLVVRMLGGDTVPLARPSQPAAARDVTTLNPICPIDDASTVNEVTLSDVSPR